MSETTNGRGGHRPGAGRPPGARDRVPRKPVLSSSPPPSRFRRSLAFAEAAAAFRERAKARRKPIELKIPNPPPGVVPAGNKRMAMDSDMGSAMGWANSQFVGMAFGSSTREGLVFPGYAFLSVLAQRPEYRTFAETIATEMTRKWIKLKVASEDEKERKREEREEKEEAEEEGEKPEFEKGIEPEGGEEGGAEDRALPWEDEEEVEEEGEEGSEEERGASEKTFENAAEGEVPTAEEQIERASEGERDDKSEKIKAIEDELNRLHARDVFKDVALHDCFFGIGHLFINFEGTDVDELQGELATDIGNGREDLSIGKCAHRRIAQLRAIEPVWTYPMAYNAVNPLQADWYAPTIWYVMGRAIHTSRLLSFVGRPVPDLLKPSYIFGGISLSQLAQPYVDIWLDVRENVANLIQAFSVMVLKTNMSGLLQPGGSDDMRDRAHLFNATRDNEGLMMIDMSTEDFQNVAAPLSGLDHLQAQAQEHMMSVARIPAVKFTGIQPTGLNASSEGEIRVFYDTIGAMQESLFRPNLTRIIDFVQLSIFGKVDEDITFDFEPLWALSEKEEAELRKLNAETDDILVNGCAALHPEEVRERIASDPDTPYAGIDVEDVPDPPQMEGLGGPLDVKGHQPFGGSAPKGGGGKGGGGGGSPFGGNEGGGGEDAAVLPFAEDDFKESEHPRDASGKFTEGSGGGGSFKTKKEHAGHLLKQGTTAAELLKAAGFSPKTQVSIPALAKKLGFTLEKIKEGGVTKYKGTPIESDPWKEKQYTGMYEVKEPSPAEIAAAKEKEQEEAAEAAWKAEQAAKKAEEEAKAKAAAELAVIPKATPQELEKAKKTVAVNLHYLPDQPQTAEGKEYAESHVHEFNKIYAGKAITTQEGLEKKVADFKAMQLKIQAITKIEKAKQAEWAAQQAEAQKKAAAEAAAKAKAEAEAAKAANAAVMSELGINEQQAEGFHALVKMMGGKQADVINSFKYYENEAKGYGYPVTGFQASLIKNYTNGGYTAINSALRSGTHTEAQHVYVKLMNAALLAMPRFKGVAQRGTSLQSTQQALYQVGHVVEQRAFTSSSITKPWSGNTQFKITATGKRGAHVKKLSSHPGEDEVVFAARTFFKITKVDGQPGGHMTVHMEELED